MNRSAMSVVERCIRLSRWRERFKVQRKGDGVCVTPQRYLVRHSSTTLLRVLVMWAPMVEVSRWSYWEGGTFCPDGGGGADV